MPTIREKIGEDSYTRLDNEANKEVALAMQFEVVDQWRQDRYYIKRALLTHLLNEFELFEEKELKFTPLDVFNILFNAKLQRSCQTDKEYSQRGGGSGLMTEAPFKFTWSEREQTIDDVVAQHLEKLELTVIERTLATEITHFNTHPTMGNASEFLEQLFVKLELPFTIQIDPIQDNEDGSHKPQTGRIAFTAIGTNSYVYFYAQAYLRTFLNILRIGGFLYRGQIDFGMWNVVIMAPTSPYFLETTERGGVFSWDEDKKKPWEKMPDGCLFLSFGYRGVTTLFLDNRTFAGIEKMFLDNRSILKNISNPWKENIVGDIATSLDILSTATQTPDLGAKILQIYCCLEHLFVPKDVKTDNIKYIIGAINVLDANLLHWFHRLYKLRCDYAHKGYVQRDEKTLSLVFESVNNTMSLLTAKLKLD